MPLWTERTATRTYPITLGIFFIVLVNMVIIYRYLPRDPPPVSIPSHPPGTSEPYPPYTPPQYGLKSVRPLKKERKFVSQVLDDFIRNTKANMTDRDLSILLENCLPNTLDTTVEWINDDKKNPSTFLITGDIPAMWIRDSSNQIAPYIRFIKKDEVLRNLVFGVLLVQADYLYYDPYANAFLRPWYAPKNGNERGSTSDRVVPDYDPDIVWESKYELDSIGHFLQLAAQYIEATNDVERVFTNKRWLRAVNRVFQVLEDQMKDTWPAISYKSAYQKSSKHKLVQGEPEPVSLAKGYRFRRQTDRPTETLGEFGIGGITRKCGLVRSAFRPSDDATTFPYLIPANAQLSVQLLKLDSYIETFKANLAQQEATVSKEVETIALNARGLGETIRKAIYEHAIVTHPTFGQVFAFEVDCYGSTLIMDDANTPSLLSLPVLGFVEKNDTIYRNTRDLILSEWNPWFFKSKFARGIGGPHTGQNMVWPMSIIMQIQTSESESEVRECIDMLKRMAKRTGSLMCESFNVNRPSSFTRPWFAWANGLAGTAILDIVEKYPHLA